MRDCVTYRERCSGFYVSVRQYAASDKEYESCMAVGQGLYGCKATGRFRSDALLAFPRTAQSKTPSVPPSRRLVSASVKRELLRGRTTRWALSDSKRSPNWLNGFGCFAWTEETHVG